MKTINFERVMTLNLFALGIASVVYAINVMNLIVTVVK